MTTSTTRAALYYPTIDIEDRSWLRSAVLLWDTIHTIVPDSIKNPYESPDSNACFADGALIPVRCSKYGDVVRALSQRTLELLKVEQPLPLDQRASTVDPNVDDVLDALHSGTRVLMHPDKFGQSQLHCEKVTEELTSLFEGATTEDGVNWLLVNETFSDLYMATMASLIAEKMNVPTVTNKSVNNGHRMITLLGAAPEQTPEQGMLISLTTKKLKIDPNTPISKLLAFKAKRRSQLDELHAMLDVLESSIAGESDPGAIQVAAERIYKTSVEKALSDLKSELSAARISSTWDGIYRAVFFTVPAQSVLAKLDAFSPHALPIQLGVGAFLVISDIVVKNTLARQKIRRSSPVTYLLDASQKFGFPTPGEAAAVVQKAQQLTMQ